MDENHKEVLVVEGILKAYKIKKENTGSYLQRYQNFWGYLFITPQILGLVCFTIGPIFVTVYLCFVNWDFINAPIFVGLENFTKLFTDTIFYKTITNTLVFVIGIVPLTTSLALFLAILGNRKIRFLGLYKASLFLPMVTSSIAISLIWYWIYAPDIGLLNIALSFFGINGPNWLRDPVFTKPALIILCVWRGVGYSFLLFLAGLKGISHTYYEAAEIDGANERQQFFYITFPLLSPVTFFILVTSFIGAFGIFNEAYMLTNGGPMYSSYTMMLYLYNYAFKFREMGQAAVVSIVLAAVQIAVAAVQFGASKKWVNYDV